MWNLYQNEKFLEPLKFSNGKTQEDIVREVLEAIREGHKIIFVHGICGTGKSAVALNIARVLGKSSIVVPGKNLQAQYKRDYERDKYLLKQNKEKLKISVITGRGNHKCKFLEDNKNAIPKIVKEVDAKLHDIFDGKREEVKSLIGKDISAANYNIPCRIEIKEKNWNKIKQYIKENKDVKLRNFLELKNVKRVSVAGACPYWSPVLPDKYELGGASFVNSIKKTYKGLDNINFINYQRKPGCKFYEQFNSFIDSDVIVFNSLKYKLESALNRKPLTEVEIIDECDEFLDSFSNQRNINIDRLQNSLNYVFVESEETQKTIMEINLIVNQIKKNKKVQDAVYSGAIISLKETGIYDVLKSLLDCPELLSEIDDESYLFDVEETARMFEDFFSETYVTFNKRDNNVVASLVITNLEKKFKEMADKNKIIVLMSGTLHSDKVLETVFGLKGYKKIQAEAEQQGRIGVQWTGLEMDCRYSNFSNGKLKRGDYLKALSKCIEIAKKPVLVHVNAFSDLPSNQEVEDFDVQNIVRRERLREIQIEDKTGVLIDRFKKGDVQILFSTRSGRGVDFPGQQCNSIIFTKYPNPNTQDAFWKILNKTKPQQYWDFYKDKARRELWQKVYRGLRFKEDHVFVLSPDLRVLEAFENSKL